MLNDTPTSAITGQWLKTKKAGKGLIAENLYLFPKISGIILLLISL